LLYEKGDVDGELVNMKYQWRAGQYVDISIRGNSDIKNGI